MDINEALRRCNGNSMLNPCLPEYGGNEVYYEPEFCKVCGARVDSDGKCKECGGSDIGREPLE